jgi:hypothetical protein
VPVNRPRGDRSHSGDTVRRIVRRSHNVPWVILDSTVLGARDRYLDSTAGRLLRDESTAGHLRLAIPEVVLIESEANYRRAVREARGKLTAVLDELEQLRAPHGTRREGRPRRLRYRTDLESLVREANGEILPIPQVPHERLVEKAARRQRPFDVNGDGYRDALVWESVLELLERDTNPVVLISNDRRAFPQTAKLAEFADELAGELTERGHGGRVDLYFQLSDFTAALPRAQELLRPWTESIGRDAAFQRRLTEYLTELATAEATVVVGPAFSGGNVRNWRFVSFSNPRDLHPREAWIPPSPRSTEAGLEVVLTLDYDAEHEAPWLSGNRVPGFECPEPPSWPWSTISKTGTVSLVFEVRLMDRNHPATTTLAGRLLGLPEPRSMSRAERGLAE